ncbi:MAG: amidase [Pseudomonadota bacterium]
MTAVALREAYLNGTRDPVEEVEACLQRCANDRLNALIAVDHDGALSAAEAARERYRRGASIGVWDGISFVAKDNIAAATLPWTAGIGAYRDRIAQKDAEVVADLKRVGAVLIGKANLHEAALGTTNDNPWYGRCHNPHQRGYTPGGSSGGSGAAVGSALVPLALGTDTLGSVRVPAAFCGVYGYKPGPGLVSQEGVTPLSPRLDTIGLISASSTDLEIYGLSLSKLPATNRQMWPTIGILDDEALAGCAPTIVSQYGDVVAALKEIDARLHYVPWFDDPSANRRAGLALVITDAYAEHAVTLATKSNGFSAEILEFLFFGRDYPGGKLQASKARIDRMQLYQAQHWASVDVVLTPVTPYPAHPFEEDPSDDLADFTAPANLIGLPAASFPFGHDDDGLPLGLQLIGKRGEDRDLLAATRWLDQALNPDRCAMNEES